MSSIHGFAGARPPRLAIRRPDGLEEPGTRAVRGTGWVGRHVHDVADANRLRVDALLRKLAGRRTLDRPLLRHAADVLRFDVEERVGRAKRDLDDLALDRDRLVDIV